MDLKLLSLSINDFEFEVCLSVCVPLSLEDGDLFCVYPGVTDGTSLSRPP